MLNIIILEKLYKLSNNNKKQKKYLFLLIKIKNYKSSI